MASTSVFSRLTRRHGIKIGAGSPCSVEEVALAVGEVIGHGYVKSAARMNSAVVLFLETVEQVNRLVETGITVNGMFEPVMTQPARKITLSNVPPFISDDFLTRELSRHGKVVSPIRKVLSGCKSPLLRHVMSHRRQLFMLLNNKEEDFDYRFRGHLIKACPNRCALVAGAAATADPSALAGWRAAVASAAAPGGRPVPVARRVASRGAGTAGEKKEKDTGATRRSWADWDKKRP
ncbi:Transposon TX1 uncharacterized 82 kDa protein ORF 1 [Larimichthys crocea]|uniref:Transposon TX1 uncharacterized 82 kDa protein ORF 1 n=1 Tax=Larimichthys crocea TaxID=215358 RepID=A0A6G0HMJ8_LARCR|nr:Transposon TX1 uncharacterized 82 kDa protein ORF 1 [Larimichthys crocea]